MEAALIHTNMEVNMYIEWPEGNVDLVIITKYFLEEYCIFLGKLMYDNIDTSLLWIRPLDKYLVNECNLKRSKVDSFIFFGKGEKGKLEFVMSVHVENVFMADKTKTLQNIKEKSRRGSIYQSSEKSRIFLESIKNGVAM